jgi:hypothetical protein
MNQILVLNEFRLAFKRPLAFRTDETAKLFWNETDILLV